ncbi:MAG: T9SS type A sorting domain-containing protein, partial [Flavobacteriales bacterium]|nr:T9SS type A sorting domain-containing protein [Flavobacteriales bacterium]
IVIDPLNQVQELDETNNEIILQNGAHTDFIPVEMEFLQLGPGLYDIEPIVDIGTNNQLAMPLEADIYVNGVLMGQDRMHLVREGDGDCPDDNCVGTCEVLISHPGSEPVPHPGVCVAITPEGCYCYAANKKLWPILDIPLSPGDQITLVLDPEGRIPEIDETNNTLVTTWFPEFDFQPVDMQFLCRNAVGYVTVPSIFILDSDGTEKPLHVDLRINGETVVSQDECSGIVDIVKCPSGGECTGPCSWKVIRKEKSNLTYTGNCIGPDGPKCDCHGTVKTWNMPAVPINPGDVLEICVDPLNLVEESDEGNNNLVMTFNPPDCVCGPDGTTMPQPVDLSKSFAPVPYPNGGMDRVQLKWYKAIPKIRLQPQDNAACDIQFWKHKDLVTGELFADPDTVMLSKVSKPGKELFKWPAKFRADGADNSKRVEPNIRYRWRVRCYCDEGDGAPGPWSVVKIFNTPDFDPITGIYTPPPEIDSGISTYTKAAVANHIHISPNPNDGTFSLNFDQELDGMIHIQLVDMTGRIVATESRTTDGKTKQMLIDFSEIRQGMYILSIRTSTDQLFVEHMMLE